MDATNTVAGLLGLVEALKNNPPVLARPSEPLQMKLEFGNAGAFNQAVADFAAGPVRRVFGASIATRDFGGVQVHLILPGAR